MKPHYLRIIEQVAFWHQVRVRDIFSHTRERRATAARLDAYAAVFWNCPVRGRRMSLYGLARRFDRHHATILTGLRRRGISRPGWPAAAASIALTRH